VRRMKARGGLIIVGLVMGTLLATFFRAQVLRSDTWALRAESNRLRPLPVLAARGTVFDRHGQVLADNVPGYAVSVLPAPRDSVQAVLERLRPFLGLSDARIERLMTRQRQNPRQPLVVDTDANFEEVAALEERRNEFPSVFMEMRPKRRYVAGPAAAHVLGYVGEVTERELEGEFYADYEQGMIVGKEGVEREYEARLQGGQGVRYVEVDALGRVVGSFEGRPGEPAVPGTDIHLNLDLDLMQWIHRIFPDTMRGAVVALDVADGGVLALYSAPTFDPNAFVGGIDVGLWSELNTDVAKPLYNRPVLGRYPPASTWKLASAAIALELGVVTATERMPIPCRGGMQWGNRYFRCWKPDGHGSVDLVDALRDSCDVYFYQMGLRVGLDRLLHEGTRLGFSGTCGVDLPIENRGIFPQDGTFWEERFGYTPTEGEVLSLSIGQGPNSQTPLKVAQFYLAIARDGSAPAPSILADRTDMPEGWSLDLSDENLEWLREGLRRVTAPGGTAYLSSLEHWDLLGKTGTGQNAQDRNRDHAWFAGMAGPPGEAPEIVVVVLVEFGESGSGVAAPIMAKTADYWLRKRHGIPIDTIQTLGEHYRTGTPAPWAVR
jgi:penicillin-binding protein 2